MLVEAKKEILQLFSKLLDYPKEDLVEKSRKCEGLISIFYPKVAQRLRGFVAFLEGTPSEKIEQIYAETFDFQMDSCLYVAYHLVGESYLRSAFLIELKKHYREIGLDIGRELPDYLPLVLQLLSKTTNEELSTELIQDAIIPALRKMIGEDKEERPSNPFREILTALKEFLEEV